MPVATSLPDKVPQDGRPDVNSHRFGLLLVLTVPWVAGISSFGAHGIVLSDSIGEIRHTGIIWLLTLYAGIGILLMPRHGARITFPWKTWLPFYAICLTSIIWSKMDANCLKLAIQMLVYPLVGIIASYTITSTKIAERMNRAWLINLVFIGLICCYYMLLLSPMEDSDDGKYRGFAARPGGATFMFISCFFLAQLKRKPSLAILGWSASFFFCLVSGGRMATAMTLSCWLTNPSIKFRARWFVAGLVLFGGIAAFNTPIIQGRFFNPETGHGGSGGLDDVASGDFDGAGRFEAWPKIFKEANRAPVFGHGLGDSIAFTYKVWPPMDKPHNDYLKIYFDSGGFAFAFFVIALLGTIAQLHWVRYQSNQLGFENWPASAAVMGLWGFAGLATVDNPLVYGNNFLHPVFMMVGIAFCVYHNERIERETPTLEEEPPFYESTRRDTVGSSA